MSAIRPQRKNANRHTERGMHALERSIEQDGWIGAITVAADGETFDGSARVETTAANGMLDDAIVVETDGSKPVIVKRTDIPTATDPRAVRLGLAANRVGQLNLEWEPDVLAEIAADGIDVGTLWTPDEWADVAQPAMPEPGAGGDEFDPTPDDGPTRAQAGDLWLIDGGRHRLIVGDCTDPAVVARLMDGERADMVWTDPPYGVNVTGAGGDAIAGDISFTAIPLMFGVIEEILGPRGFIYICGGSSNYILYAKLIEQRFRMLPRIIVWDKGRAAVMRHNLYHSCYELIFMGHRRGAGNDWYGGRTSDEADDIWRVPVRDEIDRAHPTQKPVELPRRAIANSCPPGGIVVDLFGGTGGPLVAAHREGRRAFLCEIEPRYADVILRRAEAEGLTVERAE